MRAQIVRGQLSVDSIENPDEAIHVVRLALAAGLEGAEIDRVGHGQEFVVRISVRDEAGASVGYAALLSVAAEIEGHDPENLLATFRKSTHFDSYKQSLGTALPEI